MARQGFWWQWTYRAQPPVWPSVGGDPILDSQPPPGSTVARIVGRISAGVIVPEDQADVIAFPIFVGIMEATTRLDPFRNDNASFLGQEWPFWDMFTVYADGLHVGTTAPGGYVGSHEIEFDVGGQRTLSNPLHLHFGVSVPGGHPPDPGSLFVSTKLRTLVLYP